MQFGPRPVVTLSPNHANPWGLVHRLGESNQQRFYPTYYYCRHEPLHDGDISLGDPYPPKATLTGTP